MTTHTNPFGEKVDLSALESTLAQIERAFIPLDVEHDPRVPPHGRIVSGRIRAMEDGEHALEIEAELFEPGEELPAATSDREMPLLEPGGSVEILYDRPLAVGEDLAEIQAIAETAAVEAKEEVKWSADPVAVITIAGAFALGAIATGFLSKLGEDGYAACKAGLKRLFERRNAAQHETLLRLLVVIRVDGHPFEIEAIATRPSGPDVDTMLGAALVYLDAVAPLLVRTHPDLRRVVFTLADGRLSLTFGVRKDAVPMVPEWPLDAKVKR
jgi:hypothetical protein